MEVSNFVFIHSALVVEPETWRAACQIAPTLDSLVTALFLSRIGGLFSLADLVLMSYDLLFFNYCTFKAFLR